MKKLNPIWPHALLILISGLLILGLIDHGQDWGGDFAAYIMQTKSLVEGNPSEFIEANRFTIEHTTYAFAPVAYPWGYPAMLAPIYAGFGQNIVALKSVGIACYMTLLIFIAVAFRKMHPALWLTMLVGFFAVNPTLLLFLNKVNSDIPFMLVSTISVFLIGRVAVFRKPLVSPLIDGLCLGLLIALACTIRTNGVLLLASLLVTQIVSSLIPALDSQKSQPAKQPRGMLILPYLAFFSTMILVRLSLPDGESSHMDVLRQISPGNIYYNITYYTLLPRHVYDGAPYPQLIYLLTLPLAALGVARRFRRDYYILIYLVLTYILYVLWPITQGVRFLFPILPFYLSFVVTGLEVSQGNASSPCAKPRRTLCILPALYVIVCLSVQSISIAQENLNRGRNTLDGPYTDAAIQLFDFIKTSTEPNDILVFFKPRVLRLYTGRKTFSARNTDSQGPADYLIVKTGEMKNQVQPEGIAKLTEQGRATRVFQNSDFEVYRLHLDKPGSDGPEHVPN